MNRANHICLFTFLLTINCEFASFVIQGQKVKKANPGSIQTMCKSQYYLSQCAEVAAKSPMCFTLGAVMVKGGKIISTGYNHYRTHYDGNHLGAHGHRKVCTWPPIIILKDYKHALPTVVPAGLYACRDACHLQLYWHVTVVQVAGSSDGTTSYAQKRG